MAIDKRVIIIGGVALAGAGYYFWRKKQAAAAASSTSGTSNGSAYGTPLPGGGILGPIYSPVNITNQPSNPIAPTAPVVTKVATKTPAPSKTPAAVGTPSATSLENILNQLVGTLSDTSGVNATPAQVKGFQSAAASKKLTGINAQYFEQTQNIGAVSAQMKWPTMAQINSLATSLAGGVKTYQSLPTMQKNQYTEIANVELLQQMNPGKVTGKIR